MHRAIFGSLERCIAILAEHFAGKWPFWLSPRQVAVLPLTDAQNDYAQKVQRRLLVEGFDAETDLSNGKINKKIREAQLAQFNFILVVGPKEQQNGTVNIRERDNPQPKGEASLREFVASLKKLYPPLSDYQLKVVSESQFGKDEQAVFLEKFGLTLDELRAWDAELGDRAFFDGAAAGASDRERHGHVKYLDLDAFGLKNLSRWIKSLK